MGRLDMNLKAAILSVLERDALRLVCEKAGVANRPAVLADNMACLDFSVAKGGFLCAYRGNGEQKLSNDNFVWVKGDGR